MMDRRVSGRIRKAVDYVKMAKGTYKLGDYQISGKEIVEKIVIELCNNVVKEEICQISVKEEICQISIKEELLHDSEIMTCENSIKQEPFDNIRINDPLDIHEFKFDPTVHEGVNKYENIDNFYQRCLKTECSSPEVKDLESQLVMEENEKMKLGKGVSRVSSRIKKVVDYNLFFGNNYFLC